MYIFHKVESVKKVTKTECTSFTYLKKSKKNPRRGPKSPFLRNYQNTF